MLAGVLQIIDLLEVTTQILDRDLGPGGVAYYAMLRMPRLIEQAAPLAVLAGSLFAFAKLAGESAVTAMRSTGISAYRITMMAAPTVVALALLQLVIGMVVAPRTDQMLSAWWQASAPQDPSKVIDPVTFHVGSEVVVATPRDPDSRSLEKVTLYRRDQTGRLVERTTAKAAVSEAGRWTLIEPRFETLGIASISEGQARTMDWTPEPAAGRCEGHGRTSQTLVTPAEAKRALAGGLSVRPRTFYDTQLQRAWAAPFACIVMLLLSAPACMANFPGGGATLLVQCLAGGLLFLVFDGAFTALGEDHGGARDPGGLGGAGDVRRPGCHRPDLSGGMMARGGVAADIQIVPVTGKAELDRFIAVPMRLGAGDPNYIAPLIFERQESLSPKSNPFFEHAEVQFWLAVRDGRDVGRISAQIDRLNPQTAEGIGNFGMIAAEDDPAIFAALFRTAEDWLRERGCRAALGPVNLSTNEEVGLLVEGRRHPGRCS